jgi:hypothetical protein
MSRYVESALVHLERAVAGGGPKEAREALYEFGRGVFESDVESALARFGPEARPHPLLFDAAAGSIGSLAEMWPDKALPDVLYGRSGYQFLVDADVWDEPPLSAFHLAEVDEALADVVRANGVGTDQPPDAPPSHVWWHPGDA